MNMGECLFLLLCTALISGYIGYLVRPTRDSKVAELSDELLLQRMRLAVLSKQVPGLVLEAVKSAYVDWYATDADDAFIALAKSRSLKLIRERIFE